MEVTQFYGLLFTVFGGLMVGSSAWPLKCMKKLEFEHWSLVSSTLGLFVLPWLVTIMLCPHALSVLFGLKPEVWLTAAAFSVAWGVANILSMLCALNIGVALTVGLLTGVGLPIGVLVPVLLKGTGNFKDAPDLGTRQGHILLVAIALMLVGVGMTAYAGMQRNRATMSESPARGGRFLMGMLLAVLAGLLQVGLSLSFVYTQGPITKAVELAGAGEAGANMAAWTVCLVGGGLLNLAYPLYLLVRKRNWRQYAVGKRELVYPLVMGATFITFVNLIGSGMRMMGPLGASVGFGVYQSMQLSGSQVLGFATHEWRGAPSSARRLMLGAIAMLLVAVVVMALANRQSTDEEASRSNHAQAHREIRWPGYMRQDGEERLPSRWATRCSGNPFGIRDFC